MKYYQYDNYPIEFVLSENMDKHFDSHNHVRHYVISVVMQGTAALHMENRETVCRKGDVFVIPPYAVHSVRQGKDTRLLTMCIGTALIENTNSDTVEMIREVLKGAAEQGIFGKEQGEKLLSGVWAAYRLHDRGREEMDADIKVVADKIASHPEWELSIETLAADIFVSKYYLIRKFKRNMGMTPHRFCIQNRIRKAQGLLDADKAIGRIAAEMGFYDQSHFDKAFLKLVGISPSEYVNSIRRIQQST